MRFIFAGIEDLVLLFKIITYAVSVLNNKPMD